MITVAMGANIEQDKTHPIHDATTSRVNPAIQSHTKERAAAPGIADSIHGVKWSHKKIGWSEHKLGVLKRFLDRSSL